MSQLQELDRILPDARSICVEYHHELLLRINGLRHRLVIILVSAVAFEQEEKNEADEEDANAGRHADHHPALVAFTRLNLLRAFDVRITHRA